MKQAFFELKKDWIIIPAPGTKNIKPRKAAFIFVPGTWIKVGLPCVTRSLRRLRYSGSAPLTRLVAPRSGYHFYAWNLLLFPVYFHNA